MCCGLQSSSYKFIYIYCTEKQKWCTVWRLLETNGRPESELTKYKVINTNEYSSWHRYSFVTHSWRPSPHLDSIYYVLQAVMHSPSAIHHTHNSRNPHTEQHFHSS
jgi:hypothetical protein